MAEFKIGRLRYTWKGYWVTDAFYNRDAVVSYNGKTYVCLVPHTSGTFYDDLEHYDPELGATPYWDLMLNGSSWKGEWKPDTIYTPGTIVLYSGVLYQCTTNHTSSSSINLSNWQTYIEIDSTWAGSYAPNTNYRFGDVVKYNGVVYRCIEEHTSTSSYFIDETHWEIINVGIEYKSDWAALTNYRLNDIVKYGADLWIATDDHTSNVTFSESTWDLWIPGIEYGTSWNSSTAYQIGDVVKYGGYSYVNKITNNINLVPSSNTEGLTPAWELLTTGYDIKDDWSSSSIYRVGAVVRRGSNLFTAIQDNSNQDPTEAAVSKTYVASGSSGTTLKLNNTTDLVVGMILSGNGFNKGQYITSVVDNSTIKVSQEPYSSIIDGDALSFTGVNGANWELISSGVRWTNRWDTEVEYVVGDIAVRSNQTYRCIKTHTATPLLRPDLDTTNTYWVTYLNHDQYNVLNEPGEIVVNTAGTNEALPIGSEGYLLKSIFGTPTWSNVFQTPSVYYVKPGGVDAVTSGDTWDNPYGSIKYACEQIAQGTLNPLAKTIIQQNKQFIIEEANQWVIYQVTHDNLPFSSLDTINALKTKRDTSFLLDAISYDLTRGGNSQTIAFLYTYFDQEFGNQYATPEIAALMPQFISTIEKIIDLLLNVLSNTSISTLYQVLNAVATPVPQVLSEAVNEQVLVDTQSLGDIIITALTEGDTSTIPPENQGLTATLMIKTGTYEESLPILVPANTALVGDELRGAVVRPKVVINTVATRTQTGTNLITVKTTEGLENNTPVQFVSMNPVTETNTVFGGLVAGETYYVIGGTITATRFAVSNVPNGAPVAVSNYVSQMRVYGGDALSDMFYVQNGTGLRNMTLTGLLGTLTENNEFLTRRPTGGAYVSLDPGTGPDDTSAWIYRRSPYMQNVTTFGVGAIGLKIDGTLHNGGYKSAVCNDFTQIISDGIGVWVTGPESLCEAVSVFTYYAYSGYFAEDGGRIRATNGNSSYGTYGVVAEGYNTLEAPITGTVDNRYFEAAATPLSSLGSEAEILKLQYSHAGENYTSQTTNLLTYSNLFTAWSSDSNVTLIQSIMSPSGYSDGWIATGDTSGTDSSYFYKDITISPSGAVYTALSGDSQTGGGIGATFDVTVTSTQYIVAVNDGGSGYVSTNQIQINGSKLGGLDGVNDLIITVENLSGNAISTVSISGTVPEGSTQPYTFSIFCKQGTSPSFDVTATFSGYSAVTSGVSYSFTSGSITGTTASGGMTPTIFEITPVYGEAGWYRLGFQFYDITALNDSLQIRIYPRSQYGNAGYSMFYGAQLEVGDALGFYLNTTTERFTAYANFNVVGPGSGVNLIGDELRATSIYQTRILEVTGNNGGVGYLTSINNAQSGDEYSIVIAGSDVAGEKEYLGMRLFINSGAGAGQYGTISSFDSLSKTVNVLRESFSPVEVIEANAGTNSFTLASTVDVNTLYVGQPVRFVPTDYVIDITNVSQKSLLVTGATGGTTNTLSVADSSKLAVDMPITFLDSFAGVTNNFTYYVLSIVNDTTIQVSTTLGGAAVLLNTVIGQGTTLFYPGYTSILTGNTEHMDINLPIYFTGDVFSDVTAGQTYYINEIYNSNQFTISSATESVSVTQTTAVTNNVTINDSSSLRMINPIKFTGTAFGGIAINTKYYINHVVDLTNITVSSGVVDTTASSSVGSSNLITVASTDGFIIGNPITFTGTTFGGIINDKVYYIHYVNNATSLTISTISTPLSITATQTAITSNNITVNSTTNLMPLNPIKFSGTVFGNIVAGTEYYISRIVDPLTIRVSQSILSVQVSATEATSNLITVESTTGFVAGNPIIFGGSSIGGIVSGTVYFVSAINDSTTLTISSTSGGNVVTLTTGTGVMTARTTAASVTLSNGSGSMTGTTRYTGTAVDLASGVGDCAVRTTTASMTLTTASGSLTGTSTVVKETLSSETGLMKGTYEVPLISSIVVGTTYYVKTITAGPPNLFTISDTPSGSTFSLTAAVGSMQMGESGWDHVNPGTPLVSGFDSTTVYSIEPLVTYSKPDFSTSSNNNITPQAPGTNYVSIEYGNEKFVALPGGNSSMSVTQTGTSWSTQQLPSSAAWKDIAYGNKYWVIVSSGGTSPGSKALYSNSDLVTWKSTSLPSVANWSKVVYGNGKFVAITSDSASTAYSSNFGATWSSGTGLPNTNWRSLAYGNGRFVAVATGGTAAAYSTNGTSWTASSLPRTGTWSSVAFGNGRFVAISSTTGTSAYSFDGITWYESRYSVSGTSIAYGNGVFLASTTSGTVGYTSEDGLVWFTKTVPSNMGATAFGFTSAGDGAFISVSGQSTVGIVAAGSQAKARPEIYQGKIVSLQEWDPGSNYTTSPTITITDSNATKPAITSALIGNGVLGNPTFYNRGSGYTTSSTHITVSGDGYAESYQSGLQLILENLTKVPHAGDNLTFTNNNTVYKVTDAVVLDGTTVPSIRALVSTSPSMSVALSPMHGESLTIRTKYSQVRLTNHDFLNTGYGNFEQSNYPGLPASTLLSPENEAVETNYGRVFYSSTDQDGNFKVGKLFAVEQATGIVTLSASQFGLEGLSVLKLGGIAIGGNSVIVTQFSTDSTFVANSNTIIPTQKAIKSYLTARLSQGGANTFTGQLIAGTVLIGGPDKIASTIPKGNDGSHINIPVKVNVSGFEGGGWDGDGAAMAFFMQTFVS